MSKRKAKEKAKKEKIISIKEFTKFYYIIIIYLPFSFSLIAYNHRKIEIHDSYINLKVKGPGFHQILSTYVLEPKAIYLNGIRRDNLDRKINLEEDENNVTIVWNVQLESTGQMFNGCPYILEVDLSNLDSSKVKIMNNMFSECKLLRKINFTNFNTSKVTDMSNIFVDCILLKSLDLSSFDTSNVETML